MGQAEAEEIVDRQIERSSATGMRCAISRNSPKPNETAFGVVNSSIRSRWRLNPLLRHRREAEDLLGAEVIGADSPELAREGRGGQHLHFG